MTTATPNVPSQGQKELTGPAESVEVESDAILDSPACPTGPQGDPEPGEPVQPSVAGTTQPAALCATRREATKQTWKWTVGQVQKFVACIFAPGDRVEIRQLPSRSREWADARELPLWAANLRRKGTDQNIYVGANPRNSDGGKAEHVALARCLFVDFDEGAMPDDALERIQKAGLPRPTLVVASGHGVHCYWRLTEPLIDLAAWTAAQERLIAALGSDKIIHDPPRIMRLPGFLNVKKPDEPVPCVIVEADSERCYAIDGILEALPKQDISQPTPSPTPRDTERTDEDRENGCDKCSVDSVISGVSVSSVNSVDSVVSVISVSDEQVEALLRRTLPEKVGERRDHIFDLARELKVLFDGVPLSRLKPIVRKWHEMAKSIIGTKAWEDTWTDFRQAWKNARYPAGQGPAELAFARAKAGDVPKCADEAGYESKEMRLLVGLCRELQRFHQSEKGDHFFLSSRVAGRLLGIGHMKAWEWLGTLCEDGILKRLGHHVVGSMKAFRYRYLGDT